MDRDPSTIRNHQVSPVAWAPSVCWSRHEDPRMEKRILLESTEQSKLPFGRVAGYLLDTCSKDIGRVCESS